MKESPRSNMSRRQLLRWTGVLCAGCATGGGLLGATPAGRIVDAGPAGDYAKDGIYGRFRGQGFFVIRGNGKLFALSALCTHRQCKLTAEQDRSFSCACHGSTFDPTGRVTQGPAKRDLPCLPSRVDGRGHLLVTA